MELIKWLQDWCREQFRNEFGHIPKIKICNLDNPGWDVEIDLSKTNLLDESIKKIEYDKGDNDWMFCYIKNNVFIGDGDTQKLSDILMVFRNWINESNELIYEELVMNLLEWLQNWYEGNCDGDWEHMFGVTIETLNNSGWGVKVDLEDTYLEEKNFKKVQYDNGNEDWMLCYTKGYAFHGEGDLQKLERILTIFKEWAEDSE